MKSQNKWLSKFSKHEIEELEKITGKIIDKEFGGLNLKKLRGFKNLFRVRKGRIRIIFELTGDSKPNIMVIERRKEDTYKF